MAQKAGQLAEQKGNQDGTLPISSPPAVTALMRTECGAGQEKTWSNSLQIVFLRLASGSNEVSEGKTVS